jgi:hypothetical protein
MSAQAVVGPCSAPETVCQIKGCQVTEHGLCSGNGWCMEGQCSCAPGFRGPDCAARTCALDSHCLTSSQCSDGSCVTSQAGPNDLDNSTHLPQVCCLACRHCSSWFRCVWTAGDLSRMQYVIITVHGPQVAINHGLHTRRVHWRKMR